MASNASSGEVAPNSNEPLSCTQCRNRKLKCDRVKPACTRCSKVKSDCVYPESRRKPAFKRRNVKELEERLAQVEVLLKESSGTSSRPTEERADEVIDFSFTGIPAPSEDVFFEGLDYTVDLSAAADDSHMFSHPHRTPYSFTFGSANGPSTSTGAFSGGELIDLGLSEPLPAFEVMEELNKSYFQRQQHYIPIINPTRYIQSFYSAPHMKPPMCLQYAIWALAANDHESYKSSQEIFYQRARQYAEADEMRAYGEHFITVAHAQAWCVIATYEAKCMLFTRAAMSSARSVRLVQMMGLHRLDSQPGEFVPTLMPPKDWSELEERRRTFWGAFCIDSHCSISTGWPHLIDCSEVTTHLPASESAFASGEAVETCGLDEAFKVNSYSSFAGAILVCHLFNQIVKHVHRPKSSDNPENYEYGEYWQRHRKIDNDLSSAFMFLPEPFRMPESYRDPTAIHINLNFHASVICLHQAAIEKIDEHNFPLNVKKASQNRLFTAAQEIVNIIKITNHGKSHPKSPMAALALFCAASVFIYQCKETQSSKDIDNLDFIIAAMDAIGRDHLITRAFLKQVMLDIERNGITQIGRLPRLNSLPHVVGVGNHNIPLLVRSQISRHTEIQPPLPGRLPLGHPQGCVPNNKVQECDTGLGYPMVDADEALPNKRKRTATSPVMANPGLGENTMNNDCPYWREPPSGTVSSNPTAEENTTSMALEPSQHQEQNHTQSPFLSGPLHSPGLAFPGIARSLPHRTSSPAANAESSTLGPNPLGDANGGHDPALSYGPPGARTSNIRIGSIKAPTWDAASICMHAQFANGVRIGASAETNPWSMVGAGENVDWDSIAAAAGINISTGSGNLGGDGAANLG